MRTRLLFTAIMALSLISCAKIVPNITPGNEESDYTGTVTVIYKGEPFDNENIKLTFTPDAEAGTASIKLHHIRFVPQMPVTIDVTVPGINIDNSTGKTMLSCEKCIPLALGGEFPKYTVTEFKGEIVGDELTFSLNFGEYPTSFKGTINGGK